MMQKSRKLGIVILLLILFWYASILIPRNRIWYSNDTLFTSMIHDAPQSAYAHFLLGKLYYNENKYTLSKQQADLTSAIYPDYAPLIALYADLYGQQKDYAQAEKLLLKATRLDPAYFPAFSDLAIIYLSLARYDKAADVYTAMYRVAAASFTVKDFTGYALSLTKMNRFKDSIELIQKNIGMDQSPAVQFLLSLDYYKLGNLDQAKAHLNWNNSLSDTDKLQLLETY
jgi:tetratricopeptide (TPR) repeat protein